MGNETPSLQAGAVHWRKGSDSIVSDKTTRELELSDRETVLEEELTCSGLDMFELSGWDCFS